MQSSSSAIYKLDFHHQPELFSRLLFELHILTEAFYSVKTVRSFSGLPGKANRASFWSIEAGSQSEFRTACAVTRGNLFAQILSRQTQTC